MGDYIQSQLGKDEHVVYETKNHWIVFASVQAVLTLFIAPIIAMISNEFAITNKRIIIKEGLISRLSLEINILKVESVAVQQTILGRILGYGNMIVRGTGGTNEPFINIANPLEFRRRFQELANA